MKGYSFWRECGGNICFLSLPQQRFLHRCPSCSKYWSIAPWMQCLISWWNISQIFHSGTSSTFGNFNGYRGTPSWMLFVNNTSCATTPPNQTFSCLVSVSSSDILASLNASMAIEQFAFRPVFDGSEGIISDFPARRLSHGAGGRVPFMAGTNLDEGLFLSSS